MTVVDQHGRVLGRWNVIDVLIGLVLLFIIPLLYAGYLLFRPAPITLAAVDPARIGADTELDLTVSGTGLRPYMRVSFNEHQGNGFFFSDSTKAKVRVDRLPAGVYDVILWDHAREVARLPRALEVTGAPSRGTQLDIIGSFTGVTAQQADRLKNGVVLTGLGTITQLGTRSPSLTRMALSPAATIDLPSPNAFNVAAVVRADCTLVSRGGSATCTALDMPLAEDIVLRVVEPGGDLLFQIDQVRLPMPTTPLTIRVRLGGERAALERMRAGDRDLRRQNEFAASGTITALDAIRAASPSVAVSMSPPQGPPALPLIATDLAVRDTTLTVPAQRASDAWYYAGRKLTIGGVMEFHGPDYQVRGTVLSVNSRAVAPE